MRRMIGRPARALLPLALGACAFSGDAEKSAALAGALVIARLFSLSSGAAFYAASAKIVSDARLRGNFLLALFFGALGGAGAVLLCARFDVPGIGVHLAVAGAALMLAELFSERLYALTDKLSGPLCDAIAAGLAAVGIVASRGDDRILSYFAIAALGACALACVGICGMRSIRPGAAILRAVPRALFRSWLAPALTAGFMALRPEPVMVAACALGWAAFAWADAPARRAEGESAAVDLLTMLPMALAIGAVALSPAGQRAPLITALLPLYVALALAALFNSHCGWRAQLSLLSNTTAFAILAAHALGRAPILPLYPLIALAAGLMLPDLRVRGRRRRRA